MGRWSRDAACARPGVDPALRDVFTTDHPTLDDTAAVAVCRSCCPVCTQCAAYAANLPIAVGIRGGHRRVHPRHV